VDETYPPARASPSDWLEPRPGGGFQLATGDPDRPAYRFLTEGETVNFQWVEHDHGRGELTIHVDGSFECSMDMPTVEGGLACIAELGNPESTASSIEEFVTAWHDLEPGDESTLRVVFFVWSANDTVFELRNGKFLAVGGTVH